MLPRSNWLCRLGLVFLLSGLGAGLMIAAVPVSAADEVGITPEMASVTIETRNGPVTITRNQDPNAVVEPTFAKTSRKCPPFCIEPMNLGDGVTTVAELEVISFLKEKKGIVVDARTQDWYLRSTIPGSVNIPYTEIGSRLSELGCNKSGEGWECAAAKNVLLFCNGPWCSQSPTAIQTLRKAGYPGEKIFYYRGGMQDWLILGLNTVDGDL